MTLHFLTQDVDLKSFRGEVTKRRESCSFLTVFCILGSWRVTRCRRSDWRSRADQAMARIRWATSQRLHLGRQVPPLANGWQKYKTQ